MIQYVLQFTMCQGGLTPFYIVSSYRKMDKNVQLFITAYLSIVSMCLYLNTRKLTDKVTYVIRSSIYFFKKYFKFFLSQGFESRCLGQIRSLFRKKVGFGI